MGSLRTKNGHSSGQVTYPINTKLISREFLWENGKLRLKVVVFFKNFDIQTPYNIYIALCCHAFCPNNINNEGVLITIIQISSKAVCH